MFPQANIISFIMLLIGIISSSSGFSFFAPPLMGIGALLFRPKGMNVQTSLGDNDLVEAGIFFTGAFWTSKVGGGAKVLTSFQSKELTSETVSEFRKKYKGNLVKKSKLLLCRNGKNELMGCLGIEVATIESLGTSSSNHKSVVAPLMSNVAVGSNFRRLGVGEELVNKAEQIVRKQWGYEECYLYVEKRNTPALRFYKKLGYRVVLETNEFATRLPTESGKIIKESTPILCMKKKLGGGLFSNIFS